MKVVRTVLTARVVAPKIRVSWRLQTTS